MKVVVVMRFITRDKFVGESSEFYQVKKLRNLEKPVFEK